MSDFNPYIDIVRLCMAAVVGAVAGALANHYLTKDRERRRDKKAEAARRQAVEEAARLTDAEREILHYTAIADGHQRGLVLLIPDQYIGPWVRAGGHDFVDKSDRTFQARYCDAFWSVLSRGYLAHEGGRVYRMTGAGYEKAKDDT